MKTLMILITSFFIFIACKQMDKEIENVKDKNYLEEINIEYPNEPTEFKDDKNQELIFSETVEPFIEKILKENQRRHEYGVFDTNIQHLKMFEKNGLQEIIAFSDKRYPKRIEPNYYEHFLLFALRYDSNQSSKSAFNEIRKISEFDYETFETLEEKEKERILAIEMALKPGNMVCQKANYLFSLVKTCRETPIGGKWEKYENLFLKYITEAEEEIRVLNAQCGQMKYREEKRKLGNDD